MARKDGQSRDEQLVRGLARGLSIKSAAKASGYSERQAHRKVSEAAFARRVTQARDAIVGRSAAQLGAATLEAVAALRQLLKAESESVKLGAARGIIELAVKIRETVELTARIEALEQQQEKEAANGQFGSTH